jgi:ribosomal-protein-alanine N-acetyltransferase
MSDVRDSDQSRPDDFQDMGPHSSLGPTFDFGDFPLLATERLSLCEYSTEHLEDIFAVRSDPVVQLYNSEPHRTRQDTLKFIEHERENYRLKKEIIWALRQRASGRVIGSVSVFDWDRYHRRAAMGYDLVRDCWGQGYAQEAIRAVLRFAFESMCLNRMEIWTSAANVRSTRLAERLGFVREGSLRKRILEDDGRFHDCAVFGLMRDERSIASPGDVV